MWNSETKQTVKKLLKLLKKAENWLEIVILIPKFIKRNFFLTSGIFVRLSVL